MKSHLILSFGMVVTLATLTAADVAPPQGFEWRGFVGVVVPNAAKQDPAADFRTVLSVMPNSPAAEAGIKPGDYILSVDGTPTSAMKTNFELLHALQGAPGTQIKLELRRIENGRTKILTLTRGKKLFSVEFPK